VRLGNWEDFKREMARKDQAEAERKAREHAEQVRRAEEAGKEAPPPPKPRSGSRWETSTSWPLPTAMAR
jgi:hypothetical protein